MAKSQNSQNKEEPKELSRIVGQSNEMVRKTFYSELEINDIKLFRTIISKINYRDNLFEDFYLVNYDELNLAGISNSNRFRFVTESLEKLASTYVNILDKEGIKTRVGLIRNKFKYPKGAKQIMVEIDDDLMPYLLELNGEYTKYQLSNIGKIKSVQQLKLYEMLRSWAEKGQYKTTLVNLKDYLEIKEGTYTEYGNFKARILKNAIKIINSETDIEVEIEELKVKSLKVDTLIFYIELKGQEKEKFDITEFIDKVFIDKSGVKYLIKSYIKDSKKIGFYDLELLNLDNYKITTLGASVPKEELYNIIKGRIDILETIKKAKKNKNKIDNMLKGMKSKSTSSSESSSSSANNQVKKIKIPDKRAISSKVTEKERQDRIKKFKENLEKEKSEKEEGQ